jgi:pteridine reductase
MEKSMQGKVVLVTGGAKRVGAAISRRLHAAGANIALHYRSSAHDALALQAELNALRPDSDCACRPICSICMSCPAGA